MSSTQSTSTAPMAPVPAATTPGSASTTPGGSTSMETDDLVDPMNDFLPLLPENIKQELFENSDKTTSSTANPCDSAENKGDAPETNATTDTPAQTKCVWCQQILTTTDHPKLLECLHVACGPCVKQKFSDISHNSPVLVCPVCKMDSRMEFIIDNVFLSENTADDNPGSVESTKDMIKCSSCSDDAIATSWCVECAEFICDSCVQAHQRLKITKEHTIKPKEAANIEVPGNSGLSGKSIMCHIHSQEKLSLYCETCDRLTCRDCQLVDHRDHKYKFANEIASETRNSLQALLSEISYKKVLLSSAMKVIDDRQALITEKKKELSKEIADLVVKLTNAVNMRGKQLVYRLNQVCDTKLQVLNEKKEALQLLSGHTDHCIEFVQCALDKGSDSAVLYSKKTLARHLQKVKCQRADIPNPEIPVRVQLFLSNVPELQNVIARIGTILVDGKVYPPPPTGPPGGNVPPGPTPVQNRSKQPSPNITPPLRPGMPGPGMPQMPPNNANGPGGFPNVPPMYNSNGAVPVGGPFPPNHPMGRSFSQENGPGGGFGRFPMGPPHGMPPQQHVSSSTHPQNMDLRNLLNHQKPSGPNRGSPNAPSSTGNANVNNQFNTANFMGNVPPGSGGPGQHRMGGQMGGPPPGYLAGPGAGHQNYNHGQPGANSNGMGMGGNNPRFQNFQRFAMPPAALRQMMGNQQAAAMRYPGQQTPPGYNPNSPQPGQMQPQHPGASNPAASSSSSGGAKWHIPQNMQGQQNNGFGGPSGLHLFGNGPNESFKIPLKSPDTMRNSMMMNGANASSSHSQMSPHMQQQQQVQQQQQHQQQQQQQQQQNHHLQQMQNAMANVSSTNPKTPSPSTNEPAKDFAESIDKTCEDSVNDLMATIAKLDSNGVQVLPEGHRGKTTSPQVHSSTDLNTSALVAGAGAGVLVDDKNLPKELDPNEDWCAVCMDGGELMCCDKCPKVFHQTCHIPVIDSLPDESETWQCLLCYNFADLPPEPMGEKRNVGISPRDLKILQRILLELFCQYETSMPFRHLEPDTNKAYYDIVCSPITLTMIRDRLEMTNNDHYVDIPSFILDVKRLFSNVYLYYQEDSIVYKSAQKLEKFFEDQLAKWLPKYLETESFDEYMLNPAKRIKSLQED
ncbi:E3 ubiquitin-protein ligase TRIM33-like isoform X2 [Uranotaenia lowii]|uniref:E3 ubiquitin-protein ligase TRIM33-like isoform X2 n=1 Tax=Uranotaenia lowii TaxID=190385 RepID=UPI002479D4E7|nr:E3 ubiquitin-protein ligase TRIM33-like isoform X2 [Uranotaenia lowii]XP_055612057.1 E3 ubiquitin-protein ligase TRIM33-like isoform X2 [Uranotaenia lowii]